MTSLLFAIALATLAVAYANGANDNAKGVAALAGSRMMSLATALRYGNLATLAGALTAVPVALFVNAGLIKAFGGAGLVPAAGIGEDFLLAVGIGAGATVLLATRCGIPISTTHALTGALVGAGLVAVGAGSVTWSVLGTKFVQPLLLSPLLAAAAAAAVFVCLRAARRRLGVENALCLCVEDKMQVVVYNNGILSFAGTGIRLTVDDARRCETRYAGTVFSVPAGTIYRRGQMLSGGLVSFARGLNDTPKIAGILVAAGMLVSLDSVGSSVSVLVMTLALVAVAMLAGGIVSGRRVGETMSEKITELDGEQGLAAGLVAAVLVLSASLFALPVSTTHVTCGALFGIGAVNGRARWRMIGAILLAWVTTLPLAASLAAVAMAVLALR